MSRFVSYCITHIYCACAHVILVYTLHINTSNLLQLLSKKRKQKKRVCYMYRNNARKRPPGRRCDCARVKRHPGAFTTWLGHFLGKDSPPLGDTKRKKKKTHASHTQQQHCSSNRCSSSRRPAPIKAQTTTQTLGEAHAVLVKRRPRGRARRRQVPRLRPHLLRSRSYSADHSLAFTLRALHWSVR